MPASVTRSTVDGAKTRSFVDSAALNWRWTSGRIVDGVSRAAAMASLGRREARVFDRVGWGGRGELSATELDRTTYGIRSSGPSVSTKAIYYVLQ